MLKITRFVIFLVAVLFCPFELVVSAQSVDFDTIQKKAESQGFLAVEKELDELLQQKPEARIYLYYGSQLGKLKEYQKAKKILLQATQKHPRNRSIINLTGLVHFRLDEFSEAEKFFRQSLEINPGDEFAKRWLAEITKADGHSMQSDKTDGEIENFDETQIKSGEKLPLEKQKEIARKLYLEMIDADYWDTTTFENLHREVIERCPDTQQAQISCWRISNLFMTGMDKPDFNSAIEVLEHFVKSYPDSDMMPQVSNRLLYLYRKTNDQEKVVQHLSLLLSDPDLPVDEYASYGLLYGKALENLGKLDEAKVFYQSIVEKSGENNSYSVSVAKQRLAR